MLGMDSDPFDLVGDVIDGQFRVEMFAGEGDFSVVYKGYHLGVDAPVAIKCLNLPTTLDPALVEPFVRSFREGSKLHYRLASENLNIAQSLSSGTTLAPRTGQLVPYLVREWLDGRSLTAELSRRRAGTSPGMSLQEAILLLEGAADGLAFAHAQGISHHSVNPSNLFVVTKGERRSMKLLDFGVAKVMNEAALAPVSDRGKASGLRVLMPEYAAPEQLDRTVGALCTATDVYSFALILTEMLLGRPAMSSKEAAPVAHLDPARRPTPGAFGLSLPKRVEDVLARAVSLDPASRQAELGTLWRELKGAVTSASSPTKPAEAPQSPAAEPKRPAKPRPPAPPARPPPAIEPPFAPPVSAAVVVLPLPPPSVIVAPVEPPAARSVIVETVTAPPTPPRAVPPRVTTVPAASADRTLKLPARSPRGRALRVTGGVLIALVGIAFVGRAAIIRRSVRPPAAAAASASPLPAPPLSTTPADADPSAVPSPVPLPEASSAATTPGSGDTPGSRSVAKRFRRAAAVTALDDAAGDVADCRPLGPLWGPGSIRAAFKNDGSVMKIMTGPPYAGTKQGACLGAHFRAARMPPFAGTPGAINYTFIVPK